MPPSGRARITLLPFYPRAADLSSLFLEFFAFIQKVNYTVLCDSDLSADNNALDRAAPHKLIGVISADFQGVGQFADV
jgi:hypothetical protein